jgi:phage baseplate assembly protein W
MSEIDFTTTKKREYRDVSLTFSKNPVTNDVVALTGADAVKRAVRTLLMTNIGEVPFLPSFGSNLNAMLFEPIDAITTAQIDSEIRATIAAFEPRVQIISLTVMPSEDEQRYDVSITFAMINLPEPITLTIFLSRLR